MNAFAVLVLMAGMGGFLLFALNNKKTPRYRKKTILTGRDLEFFFRLQHALPQCHVFPHVAMSALVEPFGVGRVRQSAIARIARKRVGYAVFNREMTLLAVVELERRLQPRRSDVSRDIYFSSAGVKTIRFPSKRIPSDAKIQNSILGAVQNTVESSSYLNRSSA